MNNVTDFGPEVRSVPMAALRVDPMNARFADPIRPDDADVVRLAESMRGTGLIHPALARPDPLEPDGYLLTTGRRRFYAAQYLGWDTLLVTVAHHMSDDEAAAVSAAENMAREGMHPVDEWRQVALLVNRYGWDIDRAARTLGVDPLHGPRLHLLGSMSPGMLDVMRRAPSPPTMREMRVIARATHQMQDAALAGACTTTATGGGVTIDRVNWDQVAGACQVRRISIAYAIFNPDTAMVSFADDVFAEPDDPHKAWTDDIEGFLEAQRAQLQRNVDASGGRLEWIALPTGGARVPNVWECLPAGWERDYSEIPTKWRRNDKRKLFTALHTTGSLVGQVQTVLAAPKGMQAAPAGVESDADDADDDSGIGGTGAQAEAPAAIGKAAMRLLAEKQADGVRDALVRAQGNGAATMLHLLLLTFLADNVSIGGDSTELLVDLAKSLLRPDGTPQDEPPDEILTGLAAQVIGRVAVFRAPDVKDSAGAGAHWLALASGAWMPRCDTAEILRGVSHDTLARLATVAGQRAAGNDTALRRRLADNLPDWRPVDYAPARNWLTDEAFGAEDA